jgi:hypothetical protein
MDRVAGYPRFYTRVPGKGKWDDEDGNSQGNNGNADGNGNGKGNGNGNGKQLEIWIVGADNGFQILRFTDNFKAQHQDLFEDESD